MKQKNQEGDFLVDSLGISGVSSLENMTAGKGSIRASDEAIQASDGVIRARYDY